MKRRPNHHQRRRRSRKAKAQAQTAATPPSRSPARPPTGSPATPIPNTQSPNPQHPTPYTPPAITHTGSAQDLPTPEPLTTKETIALNGLAILFIFIELAALLLLFQALKP